MFATNNDQAVVSAVRALSREVVEWLIRATAGEVGVVVEREAFSGGRWTDDRGGPGRFACLSIPVAPAVEAARAGKPETAFAALEKIAALSGADQAERIAEAVHASYRVHPAAALAVLDTMSVVLNEVGRTSHGRRSNRPARRKHR